MGTTRHQQAVCLLMTLAAGCSTVVERPVGEMTRSAPAIIEAQPASSPPAASTPSKDLAESMRSDLIDQARAWLGQGLRAFDVQGERYSADCSGFVQAVYAGNGLPFRERLVGLPASEGGATASIYRLIQGSGELYHDPRLVLPGDLIFWDDTYDRNRNGRLDDPLTHVAIAERVDADGTVHYLHRGSRGVTVGYLNLTRPEQYRDETGKPVNSGIRQRRSGDPPGTRYLASQLFVAFGRFDPELWATGEPSGNENTVRP